MFEKGNITHDIEHYYTYSTKNDSTFYQGAELFVDEIDYKTKLLNDLHEDYPTSSKIIEIRTLEDHIEELKKQYHN
jgi:hypothetical protein